MVETRMTEKNCAGAQRGSGKRHLHAPCGWPGSYSMQVRASQAASRQSPWSGEMQTTGSQQPVN
jgi:hypothetical protein